jgi:NAD(P) transhydrogenase subunit alpha
MQIGVLKETNDKRVSIIPESVKILNDSGNEIWVEKLAGKAAFFSDEDYRESGARVVSRDEILTTSDLIISISPVERSEINKIKKSAIYISSFQPFVDEKITKVLSDAGLTALSLDMIPRITLAQSMDILSSMASIAGYKAVIMAASYLPRYFPMLTTAAGTIPPAKVLVLGAGVAGLQAIATAKRLGARVEAFDTRLAAKEEVASLGAKFVEVEGATDDRSAGGYAVEQTEEYKQKQKQLIADHAALSDVIITTALLRGKPAPLLITEEMVKNMKPGSVIVDLAALTGGNCALTETEEIIEKYRIVIIGLKDLSATVPRHASRLYSKNIMNYLKVFLKEGQIEFDFEDEITNKSCIVHKGEIKYKT